MLYISAQIQIHVSRHLKNQLFKFEMNILSIRSLNFIISIEKFIYTCKVVSDETKPYINTFYNKTIYKIVVDIIKYSINIVKLISRKLSQFDIIYLSKIKNLDRSQLIAQKMILISSFLNYLTITL